MQKEHILKMLNIRLPDDPDKGYMVCCLEDDEDIPDPFDVFTIPGYDPYNLNEEGIFAYGGSLDLRRLLQSYSYGVFPWYAYKEDSIPLWHCPRKRYVIFPDKIHVGHSLRNLLNKNIYTITVNQKFSDVIHHCRMTGGRDDHKLSWLGEEMENLFIELNWLGYATSVEVWEGYSLVGGFYGFWNNGVFQGESMFSLRPSASQIGLVLLCRMGNIEGVPIKFIDTQFETPTFKRLGGEYIPYEKYREIMDADPVS